MKSIYDTSSVLCDTQSGWQPTPDSIGMNLFQPKNGGMARKIEKTQIKTTKIIQDLSFASGTRNAVIPLKVKKLMNEIEIIAMNPHVALINATQLQRYGRFLKSKYQLKIFTLAGYPNRHISTFATARLSFSGVIALKRCSLRQKTRIVNPLPTKPNMAVKRIIVPKHTRLTFSILQLEAQADKTPKF